MERVESGPEACMVQQRPFEGRYEFSPIFSNTQNLWYRYTTRDGVEPVWNVFSGILEDRSKKWVA